MASTVSRKSRPTEYPELHTGDSMTRAEFHRAYEQMPDKFKAELIEGVVYVAVFPACGFTRKRCLPGTLFVC
jgi:hypothetical protein